MQESGSSRASFFTRAQQVYIYNSRFDALVSSTAGVGPPIAQAPRQASREDRQTVLPATADPIPNLTLYQRLMTHQRRGFPLCFPQPSHDKPVSYRIRGTSIGDVGYFNQDGGFDFLFNILLPADHPINQGDVPDDFEPLSLSGQQNFREHLREERYLAKPIVEMTDMNANGLAFESNAAEGAILVMPGLVRTTDCTNISALRSYADRNAESWYSIRMRPIYYLGYDHVLWSAVSVQRAIREVATTRYAIHTNTDGIFLAMFRWCGPVKGWVDFTRHCGFGDDSTGPLFNQSLFLRTLTITLGDSVWRSIGGGDSIAQELDHGGVGLFTGAQNISFTGGVFALAVPFVFMLFQNSGGNSGKTLQASPEGVAIEQYDLPPVCHPSTAINSILLNLYPNARVAITSDSSWVDDLPEDWLFTTPEAFAERLQVKMKAVQTGDLIYIESAELVDSSAGFHDGLVTIADLLANLQSLSILPKSKRDHQVIYDVVLNGLRNATNSAPSLTAIETQYVFLKFATEFFHDRNTKDLTLMRSADCRPLLVQYLNDSDRDQRRTAWTFVQRLTNPCMDVLSGHTNPVSSVAFSPDGKLIASGSWDRTIRLWDVNTGQPLGDPLKGHDYYVTCVAFSADGRFLASASFDTTVRIWDAATGECRRVLKGHTRWVHSVVFAPKLGRKLVVSASRDGTVRVWNYETGDVVRVPLEGHAASLWAVAVCPSSKLIAFGSDDGTIRLWDHGSELPVHWSQLLTGHSGKPVLSIAFSPDGRHLASGGMDNMICIWDASTNPPQSCKPIRTIRDHTAPVWSVAFSPHGRWITSGSYDKTVRLWNMEDGSQIGEPFRGHKYDVESVAFSPDGAMVVSGSEDMTVRIWDVSTAKLLQELKVDDEFKTTNI